MYLEHLEYKLAKYETYLVRMQKQEPFRTTDAIPSQQETELRKQRVSLVRANEKLKRQLMEREQQLKEKDRALEEKLAEIAQLRHLKPQSVDGETLRRSFRLLNTRSDSKLASLPRVLSQSQKGGEKEAWLINISGNHNEVNCFVGPKQ
jgi:hypothetical protein